MKVFRLRSGRGRRKEKKSTVCNHQTAAASTTDKHGEDAADLLAESNAKRFLRVFSVPSSPTSGKKKSAEKERDRVQSPHQRPSDSLDVEWYYVQYFPTSKVGPASKEALLEAWEQKALHADSLVWTRGLPRWIAIQALPILHRYLSGETLTDSNPKKWYEPPPSSPPSSSPDPLNIGEYVSQLGPFAFPEKEDSAENSEEWKALIDILVKLTKTMQAEGSFIEWRDAISRDNFSLLRRVSLICQRVLLSPLSSSSPLSHCHSFPNEYLVRILYMMVCIHPSINAHVFTQDKMKVVSQLSTTLTLDLPSPSSFHHRSAPFPSLLSFFKWNSDVLWGRKERLH